MYLEVVFSVKLHCPTPSLLLFLFCSRLNFRATHSSSFARERLLRRLELSKVARFLIERPWVRGWAQRSNPVWAPRWRKRKQAPVTLRNQWKEKGGMGGWEELDEKCSLQTMFGRKLLHYWNTPHDQDAQMNLWPLAVKALFVVNSFLKIAFKCILSPCSTLSTLPILAVCRMHVTCEPTCCMALLTTSLS